MKKTIQFATAVMLLGTSLFATSCDKSSELNDIPEVKPELKGVGFAIEPMALREWNTTVPNTSATRATAFNEFVPEITFSEGDMLYVEAVQYDAAHNPIATCVGNLTMDSGADQKEATFSGEIFAPEGTKLDDFEDVIYYLIGANDKRAKLVDVEGADVKAVELPLAENHIVGSFREAIEKYSEIGFVSPKFTDQVKLKQSNAYFVFSVADPAPSIDFDDIASAKAIFTRPDGTTLEVTTEEKPSTFERTIFGGFTVVVPCAIEEDKEQFSDIKLELTAKNGNYLEKSFPSTEEVGNTVEQGEVYILTTVMNTLNSRSHVGDIGEIDGRSGIVVDLEGNIGKVAIAEANLGAQRTDDAFDFGGYHYLYDTDPETEWYIPTIEEYKALTDMYKVEIGNYQDIDYLVASFNISSARGHKLYFPLAGYKNGPVRDEDMGYYWTRSIDDGWFSNIGYSEVDKYYILKIYRTDTDMIVETDNTKIRDYYNQLCIRLFHKLK